MATERKKKEPKFWVEKRNILNDIIAREFTLQELRLFSIYLGRINARDLSTRKVRLTLKQFYRVMGLQTIRIEYLKAITKKLLQKVVSVPTETGGYNQFQLFKRCTVDKDDYGQEYFEIDANDDALQLMFNYQKPYFKYDLWNVLNLESVNQFRMYEIVKQGEYNGERTLTIKELRDLLGVNPKEYQKYNDFRRRVLDSCQKALAEKTDIIYTYEPIRAAHGKITSLRFTITKNPNHVDKLNLSAFLSASLLDSYKENTCEESQLAPDESDNVPLLPFIKEPLTRKDRESILNAADGDFERVKHWYEMALEQSGIKNLTAWLIGQVKSGEVKQPVKVKKINRFVNFNQRNIDFAELERLELEQLKAEFNKNNPDIDTIV
jgi:plasmid replication initiation protein